MNVVWEFFFCPVHGLLRADNIALLVPTACATGALLRGWAAGIFRRWL